MLVLGEKVLKVYDYLASYQPMYLCQNENGKLSLYQPSGDNFFYHIRAKGKKGIANFLEINKDLLTDITSQYLCEFE